MVTLSYLYLKQVGRWLGMLVGRLLIRYWLLGRLERTLGLGRAKKKYTCVSGFRLKKK